MVAREENLSISFAYISSNRDFRLQGQEEDCGLLGHVVGEGGGSVDGGIGSSGCRCDKINGVDVMDG